MSLSEGQGAGGVDIDLLAAWDFDVLFADVSAAIV
jgi:hypothetical protein